jgi:hypothetical protein
VGIEDKYEEVRHLINIGREKGYLVYDEVNDILPEEVSSPEEIDDIFLLFDQLGIEVVDSEASFKRKDEKVEKEAEPEAEPAAELDAEPTVAAEPEPETQAAAVADVELAVEPDDEPTAEADLEPETAADAADEPEPEADAD